MKPLHKFWLNSQQSAAHIETILSALNDALAEANILSESSLKVTQDYAKGVANKIEAISLTLVPLGQQMDALEMERVRVDAAVLAIQTLGNLDLLTVPESVVTQASVSLRDDLKANLDAQNEVRQKVEAALSDD